MKKLLASTLLLLTSLSQAQIINTATMDTADYLVNGKLTVEGYLDVYYAYNFNRPASHVQPYLVSMNRHNEMNINLAFVDLKYSSSRVRARIAPGFGTYMNTNYSNENGTLQNLVEANVGYRVSKHRNIWIDVGVLGSPYTNESAISKDHLVYTRSLAAENVPYYLSGAKLSVPLTPSLNLYLYAVNGWQQITDQNNSKSFGTQLEWRPGEHTLLNWNTFLGNERSAIDSVNGLRSFSDVFMIYQKNKWSLTSCLYAGRQATGKQPRFWWQANVIAKYQVTPQLSLAGRLEYFQDDDGVVVVPQEHARQFRTFGSSIGVNINPEKNILFRGELRQFFSTEDVFQRNGYAVRTSTTITFSGCVWF